MQITYGQTLPEDAGRIYGLCRETVEKYEDPASVDLAKVLAWLENKIRKNVTEYTRIFLDGELCGYYRVCREGEEYELDDFYLFEEYRGRGIGTRVLDHILEDEDADFFLYVFKRNTPALKLYQKYGFTVREDLGNRYIMERRR